MKQTKFKITLIALATAFILSVAALFAINFKPAEAAGSVSLTSSGSSAVFTSTNDANIVVYESEEVDEANSKPDSTVNYCYSMFTFANDDDTVYYRRNLAYSWWYQQKSEAEEGEEEGQAVVSAPVNGRFSMEVGFPDTDFNKFVIAFESQQYSKTKDGKTVNYIMFFPDSDVNVKVLVTDDKDATKDDVDENSPSFPRNKIGIRFVRDDEAFPETLSGGEYGVVIGCPDGDEVVPMDDQHTYATGVMKNVGGTYSKFSSSSTTPVYPLIFSAEFNEEEEEAQDGDAKVAKMVLYSINNQKFRINDSRTEGDITDYRVGGTVTDDTPAVLCLNTNFSHLNKGGSIKFDFQVIDVLRSSPSSTLYYYLLTVDDHDKGTVDFNDYENVYDKKDKKDGIFKEVDSDYLLESDSKYYLPKADIAKLDNFAENLNVDMAVKVFAKVVDTTSNGEDDYVFLDWYLAPQHKLTIDGCDFIPVGKDDVGITYNYGGDTLFDEDNAVRKAYQERVDEAAKNLSAGSSSYFYLPSAEDLFVDNATAYRDMKVSIYYFTDESSQNTSLATNNLSINVTEYGTYWFTVYATDAASNSMYYMEDGERVEFKTTEISDIFKDTERHDYLPWFKFKVNYDGAQFDDEEKPSKQSTAYVGTVYTGAQFTNIKAIPDSYSTTYRLFVFDRAGYFAATGKTFSYEEFIDEMDKIFAEHSEYFSEIKEVTESDEDYEQYSAYEWSSTSTSFVPQDANAFYYMLAELQDQKYVSDPLTYSLAIIASDEAKTLKGDSEWLQNNVASVVLLSVAGVSLIAIILLLVIKPKSKEDIDVQFEQEKNKKNKK